MHRIAMLFYRFMTDEQIKQENECRKMLSGLLSGLNSEDKVTVLTRLVRQTLPESAEVLIVDPTDANIQLEEAIWRRKVDDALKASDRLLDIAIKAAHYCNQLGTLLDSGEE
jgi:hypothetical protein